MIFDFLLTQKNSKIPNWNIQLLYLSLLQLICVQNFFLVQNRKNNASPYFSCMNYDKKETNAALLNNRKKLEMFIPDHFVT